MKHKKSHLYCGYIKLQHGFSIFIVITKFKNCLNIWLLINTMEMDNKNRIINKILNEPNMDYESNKLFNGIKKGKQNLSSKLNWCTKTNK